MDTEFPFQDITPLGTPYTWLAYNIGGSFIRKTFFVRDLEILINAQPDSLITGINESPFQIKRGAQTIWSGKLSDILNPKTGGTTDDKIYYLIDTFYQTKRSGSLQFSSNVQDNFFNSIIPGPLCNMLFGGTIINPNGADAYLKFHRFTFSGYDAIGNTVGNDFIRKIPANGEVFLPISYPFPYTQYAYFSIANDVLFTSFLPYALDLQFSLIYDQNV